MKKSNYAELKMKKVLRAGDVLRTETYACEVLQMKEEEEVLYLVLKSGELSELSLDCIYQCTVKTDDSDMVCTGRIKERFRGTEGKTLKLQIENGFYKITIK